MNPGERSVSIARIELLIELYFILSVYFLISPAPFDLLSCKLKQIFPDFGRTNDLDRSSSPRLLRERRGFSSEQKASCLDAAVQAVHNKAYLWPCSKDK